MTDRTRLAVFAAAAVGIVATAIAGQAPAIAVAGVSTMLVAAMPTIKAVRTKRRDA